MCHDAKTAQPMNIFDDVPRFPAERIGRRRHVEREVMTARGADFDAVQAEDACHVSRGIRRSGGIAVIGEDDERQPGAGGDGADLVGRTAAVRSVGMNVQGPGNRPVALPSPERSRRGRERSRGDE